ncbi:MFS transporter [Chelatococcus asaccharovorans]|uniref:MFS transporter n=1 Tax=Chelatococcus asaccharovorans TaxID=28210 RepID=UPI00224C7425|nr:MFS transporter [Chelatococcus asaccharovorans]CAH1653187.1 putative MFS family arabinose efflux permease [Chelatococcus asaccharovorans]CAH1693969.1 putative MFS family arabinose efflux permease [Chelatococcus asaccharovorans]
MKSVRIQLSAILVLVLVMALAAFSWRTAGRAETVLLPELEAKAATVADSVASLIGRALDLGIPLDRLQGVGPYLDRTVAGNPDIAFAMLRAPDGAVLNAAGALPSGMPPLALGLDRSQATLSVAVRSGPASPAVLTLGLDPAFARKVVSELWIDLAIIMIVTALVALELMHIAFGAGLYGAIEGVETRLDTIARDDLSLHPAVDGGSEFGRLAARIDRRLVELNRRYLALVARLAAQGDALRQAVVDGLRRDFKLGEGSSEAPVSVIAVRAPLFIFMLAEELTRPFLPIYIKDLAAPIPGLSPAMVTSLPMVAFLAVVALSQPILGGVTDRLGRRTSLVVGAALGLAGYIGSAMATDLIMLTLARMISGLGFAAVFVSAQGYVIDNTDLRQRASGMAMFIGAILVAGLCGPPIGGILADRLGIRATFVIAGLVAGASLVLALIAMPRARRGEHTAVPKGPTIRWRDFGPILASPPLACLFFLCALPAKIILVAYCFFLVPLHMQALGAGQAATGRLLMVYPIAMVILVPVFAALASRFNQRAPFVALGGIVAGLSGLSVLISAEEPLVLALMLGLFGIGQAISIAPQSALVGEFGRALAGDISDSSLYGIFRLVERTGNALGPACAGFLLGRYGFTSAVIVIGLGMAFASAVFVAVFAYWRSSRHATAVQAE